MKISGNFSVGNNRNYRQGKRRRLRAMVKRWEKYNMGSLSGLTLWEWRALSELCYRQIRECLGLDLYFFSSIGGLMNWKC